MYMLGTLPVEPDPPISAGRLWFWRLAGCWGGVNRASRLSLTEARCQGRAPVLSSFLIILWSIGSIGPTATRDPWGHANPALWDRPLPGALVTPPSYVYLSLIIRAVSDMDWMMIPASARARVRASDCPPSASIHSSHNSSKEKTLSLR